MLADGDESTRTVEAEVTGDNIEQRQIEASAKRVRTMGLCSICGATESTKFFNISIGVRSMIALVLRCIPPGLDSIEMRQCAACRKCTDSSYCSKWVKESKSNKVDDDCARLLVRSPQLEGTITFKMPQRSLGEFVPLRDGLRSLRDSHCARGLPALDEHLILLDRSVDRRRRDPSTWEFLPAVPGADVVISAQKGDDLAQGLYVVIGSESGLVRLAEKKWPP